jgi:NAD(P)-dependent dehydrogenase (short-subunit alcohol dehydrogenase family)
LSQAKTTVAELLRRASPEQRLGLVALAADSESDQMQAFGDSTVDQTNDAEVERFRERVAERTGGEFALVVNEVMVVPGLGPVEHLILAHYSGGTAVGGASARVDRQPGQAPKLSEWQDTPA